MMQQVRAHFHSVVSLSGILFFSLLISLCTSLTTQAKSSEKKAPMPQTELSVEVPQTLANSHSTQSAFIQEALNRPQLVESVSLTVSTFVAQKMELLDEASKIQTYEASLPNVEVNIQSRPFYAYGAFSLRASLGLGVGVLDTERRVTLPTGSQKDRQSLYLSQVNAGLEADVAPFPRAQKFRLGLRGSAGPAYAFSSKSLSSEGQSYWGLALQTAAFVKYTFESRISLALQAGLRSSKLETYRDAGAAVGLVLGFRI